MKRFLFAAALVALIASVGTAEEKPTAPAPAAAPVVISTPGTPVAEYAPAQPQRRGLFGRLRNRGTGTTTYSSAAPVATPSATTITTPTTAPTPMPAITAPQPMPMPGTKTGSAMPMTGTVVQASGNLPAGTYTTTDGTIIQIGGTETETATATEPSTSMSSQSQRRGLFSRLRTR